MDHMRPRLRLIAAMAALGCAVTSMQETAGATQARTTAPAPIATTISVQPPARPQPVPTLIGPGPVVPLTFTGLSHLVGGRWIGTRTVRLNEPLRFSVQVQDRVPGWSHLQVHFRIRRTFIGGAHGTRQFAPHHIFRVGMRRVADKGGYTRYIADVQFHARGMLGVLLAVFHIANGTGYMEPDFLFTVRA